MSQGKTTGCILILNTDNNNKSYTYLLTEITHIDHDLQLPAARLRPAQEVLQARLEGGDEGPECLCLRVGVPALLELLCLRHQRHGVVPSVLQAGGGRERERDRF